MNMRYDVKIPIRHGCVYAMYMPCSEACMSAGIADTFQLVVCLYPVKPNEVQGAIPYVDYTGTPSVYFVHSDGSPTDIRQSLTYSGFTTAEVGIFADLPTGYYFHPVEYVTD